MQKLSPDYAEKLHADELKPFSQFLYFDKEKNAYVWQINTLTQKAKDNIIIPLITDTDESFKLEQKGLELKISDKILSPSVKYKNLAEDYYLKLPCNKRLLVKFITPCSFKSGGDYVIFPEVHNIYGSLYKKWNTFASDISLEDKDALDHLIKHTKIIGYNLKSTKFGMESIKINSFLGEICLLISGPEQLARIANLMFAFGEYSGIGAKTALGMGGIKVE